MHTNSEKGSKVFPLLGKQKDQADSHDIAHTTEANEHAYGPDNHHIQTNKTRSIPKRENVIKGPISKTKS